jgi:hypothetical protein
MCFSAAYFFHRAAAPSAFTGLLISGGLTPSFVTCGAYLAFALRNRESLQSEAYQLQHEALKLIEKSGTPLKFAPVSIEAITTLTAGRNGPLMHHIDPKNVPSRSRERISNN